MNENTGLGQKMLFKVKVSTEAFVGTNAVIGFMVDMARIVTYAAMFLLAKTTSLIGPDQWLLILTGIFAAFAGVMIGKRFLHNIAMKTVQTLTGVLLLGIVLSLGAGLI